VREFAVYTSIPNTRLCDVPLLPFDQRPDPAMMESAREMRRRPQQANNMAAPKPDAEHAVELSESKSFV
jgi:hypothetical protein